MKKYVASILFVSIHFALPMEQQQEHQEISDSDQTEQIKQQNRQVNAQLIQEEMQFYTLLHQMRTTGQDTEYTPTPFHKAKETDLEKYHKNKHQLFGHCPLNQQRLLKDTYYKKIKLSYYQEQNEQMQSLNQNNTNNEIHCTLS